jgi:hypothetical protein
MTTKPFFDAEAYKAIVRREQGRAIAAHAAHLKRDPDFRRLTTGKCRIWVRYFKRCQRSPGLFLDDPFLIDRFLAALELDAEAVGADGSLEIGPIIARIRRIAEATAVTRAIMQASACLVPHAA